MITGDIPGDEALKSLSPSPGLASPNKERNGKGKGKKKRPAWFTALPTEQ
jgi:hypothetical protein